ncbi:MAG: BamA/TamA family outer membrane protein [Bacteroidota bacterium]
MTRRADRPKIRGRETVLLAMMILAGASASAQNSAEPRWAVRSGSDALAEVTADSTEAAGAALAALEALGYRYARVDSIGAGTVHVTPGPRVVFGRVEVVSDSLPADRYRAVLGTREGEPAVSAVLTADLARLGDLARGEGFANPRLAVEPGGLEGDTLPVVFRVREGRRLLLDRVVLRGASRTSDAFAIRASGLTVGVPLVGFEAARVRQSLLDSGAFASVGAPEVVLGADGALVVEVLVEEGPPGAVDAVLGYLPPTAGRSGEVVGTARVDLASPFGGGRTLAFALDRSPGLASRLSASVADPFVLGLPVRAGLGFEGEGRDSTFSRQRVEAEAGIRLGPGLTLAVTGSREGVQPGRAGARTGEGGVPRVRRSSAWFGGLVLRYTSVDSRLAPRRGLRLVAGAEQGIRSRDPLDAIAAPTRLAQQRLDASARVFVPVTGRLVAVAGADARVLLTERGETTEAVRYDEGELFRFGGAASLRGYDEDAFVGNAVGRALAELRAGLGGAAFAFAFVDVGVVRRPALASDPAETRTLPGYGAGAQLETGAGLVALTYALNPDLPAARGKVHLRLRLGL